ncbi:putative ATP-dependent endonuclease of OLD family [Streptacidiphilus sp. MAP12-16]|uniref:ATP-dependent nuclease n=1 Tax=Streptacidiphilus sp. MAP12-16 TaxID=3156300 RepID=UPI0035142385
MLLTGVTISNFRALENVEIQLDELITLIVGRNNSGKTSFVNLFEKFYSDDVKFVLEDFSARSIGNIKRALDLYARSQAHHDAGEFETAETLVAQATEALPAMRLTVTIQYDENEDLASISDLILDLDENCYEVKVEATVSVTSPQSFLADFYTASCSASFDPDKFLRRTFGKYFAPNFFAVSAVEGAEQRQPISRSAAVNVLSVEFIYAQNKFDDSPSDKTRNLSKTFEAFYKANSDVEGQNLSIGKIETALTAASKELDENYEELFGPLFSSLQTFGVDTIAPVQRPHVVSLIEGAGLLRGSTRIQYQGAGGGVPLPEGHNGLGYSKLIFTILQVIGFHQAYLRQSPRPALQLLFIEEPEAHLHPQMQETFIRNIRAFIKDQLGWNVQVVITTHSSHIVASGGFSCVRYFDSAGSDVTIKDLSRFRHQVQDEPEGKETLRFLQQYMVLQRCDMFFADKVILIEGAAERLLLPAMIQRCAPELTSRYVSVVEVGDAYAPRFRQLLAFLGVPTLIVTDLDSVDPDNRNRACPTNAANAVTSNCTLKQWLPGEKSVRTLLDLDPIHKTRDNVRVAYQVPERDNAPCGRSFEDAFILANSQPLADHLHTLALASAFTAEVGKSPTASDIENKALEIARRLGDKKTDFAFDVMLLPGWSVPRYIREGLQWLS